MKDFELMPRLASIFKANERFDSLASVWGKGLGALTMMPDNFLAASELSKFRAANMLPSLLVGKSLAALTMRPDNFFPKSLFDSSFLSGISKVNSLATSINTHKSAIDTFGSIFENNRKMSSVLDFIGRKDTLAYSVFSKSGLQCSLASLSSGVVAYASIHKDWDFLEKLGTISASAVALQEDIAAQPLPIDEYLEKVKMFIADAIAQLRENLTHDRIADNKTVKAKVFDFITVIGFILAVYSIKLGLEASTKEDIQTATAQLMKYIGELHQEVRQKQNGATNGEMQYRRITVANRKCEVRVNPKAKSFVLATMAPFTAVTVITTNHEWIYVMFTDVCDSLPKAGWVLKKYLTNVTDNTPNSSVPNINP